MLQGAHATLEAKHAHEHAVLESGGGKAGAQDPSLELPDGMPIVEAYFRHVERHIYSHPKARKMLSLDGDPVRGGGPPHLPSWC